MPANGDFRDVEWEPSEAEHAALIDDFELLVSWRKAMANQGQKVLASHLSSADALEAARQWSRLEREPANDEDEELQSDVIGR